MMEDGQLLSRFPALNFVERRSPALDPTSSLPEPRLDSTQMLERVAPVRQENKKGLNDDSDSLKTYMAQSAFDSISVNEDDDLEQR